mmetsp:Transcript_15908/g.42817  ORF Transcript_15908/g.42817 Transcript_15908/m.42817 type:complete len:123 (-) Transcript_15908:383-751(-)|eukprot:CAMPEP_0185187020 /NCGR_PEP_ID=MMETSP1140-20130426/4457_1 /TAXON_ID=298111 /ORGANISM="Pavlova sp., Strain CCMP459" /LENGTH=122 /DNA_ID=CAMNT_0027753365 /DNA_START=62 /DNA_END=430 /DNA_ORIENTATION=-
MTTREVRILEEAARRERQTRKKAEAQMLKPSDSTVVYRSPKQSPFEKHPTYAESPLTAMPLGLKEGYEMPGPRPQAASKRRTEYADNFDFDSIQAAIREEHEMMRQCGLDFRGRLIEEPKLD